LHMVLNVAEFNMNVQEATNVPRFHHQWFPDQIFTEPGISIDTRRLLAGMGHKVNTQTMGGNRIIGAAQSIALTPGGMIHGAADPRRPGSHAAGY